LASTTFYAIIATCCLPGLLFQVPCEVVARGTSILSLAISLTKRLQALQVRFGGTLDRFFHLDESVFPLLCPSRLPFIPGFMRLKMKVRFFPLMAFAILTSALLAHAQEQGQTQGVGGMQSPAVTSQPSSVDNSGIRNYLLGPGDVLDVRVFGQPDLNAIAEVDSDGNISSLPFLETPIPAKCRTERQVQKDIAASYGKYLKDPQVSVRITERKSRQPATVFGAVRQPTRVQMQRKVRLNELMAASGGFTERAAGTIQVLHTEPIMCPEPGDEAAATPIDGTKIPLEVVKISDLRAGKAEANPIVRPGDYILVTEAEPVYVTGSVYSPQGVFMREQLTLSRALAMVGGVKREARTSDVRIYRQKPGTPDQETIHVDLSAIKKNQKPDLLLQPYDVIEVPEAGMFSASRLGPTLIGAVSGGIANMFNAVGAALPMRVIY
jgi:polysaccharide biosynthesis/export protein